MRTINEMLLQRLNAQCEEAEVRGLTKIASNLTNLIEKSSVRENTAPYTYPTEDFRNDVEGCLWNAVLRYADFHNVSVDAEAAQNIVETFAEDLIQELQIKTGIEHGVGAFEPSVPGETREVTVMEVDEND